jgi:hypothetical protein
MRQFTAPFRASALALLLACNGGKSGLDGDADDGADVLPDDADSDMPSDPAVEDGPEDPAFDEPVDTADDGDADAAEDFFSEEGEDACEGWERFCLDHVTRRFCDESGPWRAWRDEVCPDGSGCVLGECVPGRCSDACTLGETDGGRTCELFDMTTGAWVEPDPAGSMHDRARAYTMWLRRGGMAYGGVEGNARYTDPPAYTTVAVMGHTRDTAIWTGTYLAAEAFRLAETGSADARRHVEELVETLHLWFNVMGQPGLLARMAAPAGDHPLVDMDCSELEVHCNVAYGGALYDARGHVSRDQYQGVMLGYAAAYEALGELGEEHRAMIREDVMELVYELMLERDVPVRITLDGVPIPAFTLHMRFAVLAPMEMSAGAVQIILDSSDLGSAEMTGFQEFMPNLGHLVSQIPLLGWATNIPRSSSAIMLSSFFRVAMLVTDGVPGYEADHDAFADYYDHHTGEGGNVTEWLDVARTWSYTNPCGEAYYGTNISMQPMYNWARLEDDFTVLHGVLYDVLEAAMWPSFVNTKNPFFSFIYAGNVRPRLHAPRGGVRRPGRPFHGRGRGRALRGRFHLAEQPLGPSVHGRPLHRLSGRGLPRGLLDGPPARFSGRRRVRPLPGLALGAASPTTCRTTGIR